MRIIAGQFKNRTIAAPKGQNTRPTSSLLRETIFNILQYRMEGAEFLDLFSGSGAIGLEALSREAKSATFIDSSKEAIKCLKKNAEALQVETQVEILFGDVFEKLKKLNRSFDVIFADPPYGNPKLVRKLFEMIDKSGLLKPGGWLLAEDAKGVIPKDMPLMTLLPKKQKRSGRTELKIYEKSPIPWLGLGTWMLRGEECSRAVKEALNAGYRHIDTAIAYENHEAVAKGIEGFDRSSFFLTTKFSLGIGPGIYGVPEIDVSDIAGSARRAVDRVLNELKTPYIDAYLIHWPNFEMPMEEILEALLECKEVKAVGYSNASKKLVEESKFATYNQVELHPYLQQRELFVDGVQTVAYRPFGKGALLKQESLFSEMGKSPSQIILRWFYQKQIPVVAKATSKEHILENANVFDFELTKKADGSH